MATIGGKRVGGKWVADAPAEEPKPAPKKSSKNKASEGDE